MKELEKIIKAFANRRRLAILRYLKRNKEAMVGEIAEEINLSFKSTSRHLVVLASADILDKEQRRLEAWYFLSSKQHPAAKFIISLL